MYLILWTNRRTNIDFPLPVGPAIILVNGCTHGMKWSGSYPSGTPQKNRIIGFQYIIGFSFITLWVLLLLRLRRHISICQRRRWRCISLCQRRRLRIALGQSSTFGLMTLIPVTSLSDTSHPLAMLLMVIRKGTFWTTTMVRKKRRNTQNILPVMT